MNQINEVIRNIKPMSFPGNHIILPKDKITIDPACFSPLATAQSVQRITFIDGGQSTVFTSPSLHIEFVRIFCSTYHGTNSERRESIDTYLLITTTEHEGELCYKTTSIPDRYSFPLISLNDPALCTRGHTVAIGTVATSCRALCEYNIILGILTGTEPEQIICRDGDLDSHTPSQERVLADVRNIALHRGVTLCGVSKTTTLLTNTGISAVAALACAAPQGAWTYGLPESRVRFAKFHPRAEHIFRVDIIGDADLAMRALASHSTDPAFLGYPYGLLDADANARVGADEAKYLQTLFWANIGEKYEMMKLLSSATDGHSVLDRVKYH